MNHKTINRFFYYTITVFINLLNPNRSNSQARPNKGNALYSLGVMFYNAGAKILADANPIATSDPDKYAAEKKKADAQMAKAKGYLEQAVALNAADANSKKILDAINAAAK